MTFMNTHPACDLSIVIVSWNVWPLLEQCLRSIERATLPGDGNVRRFEIGDWRLEIGRLGDQETPPPQSPISQSPNLEVIVVDNASSDGTPAHVATHFPWVQVIASAHNLGFTGGNNRGYAASRGRFVYFLNPDTELVTSHESNVTSQTSNVKRQTSRGAGGVAMPDAAAPLTINNQQLPINNSSFSPSPLAPLYATLAADPSIGIAGPQLRYGDGSPQPSARRFPTPLTGFFESTWLGRAWPGNPWARAMLMTGRPAGEPCDADWLVGAALCCRREALESVATPDGPFDEGFFMYSEELDLCRRVKEAGWRVVYAPAALVIHHEGKSSEQVSTQRHIRFNTSKVRYWRKWFGPAWAEALRRYLLLEYHTQLWVERVKLWLGHKPALRRERIAAYRAVIASQLRSGPGV